MITFSLQSGSNGNCIYVEAGGARLLFDAGISGRCAEGRLRIHGRDIRQVNAVLISHDHFDHVRGAGVFQRKYGLPIFMTPRTRQAAELSIGPLRDVHHFEAGRPLRFDGVTVYSIPTPHDAVEGVAFVVEFEGRRLGILTDLGHPFPALHALLPELDACYIESNYDPRMLAEGPYAPPLKQRVAGPAGHLANHEAALLIHRGRRRLRWAALAHLSAENNRPELALATSRGIVGADFPLHIAGRHEVGPLLTL